MLILGLFGCGVLSSIYNYHLKTTGIISVNRFSLFVVVWFFIGIGPFMINFPIPATILGIFVWLVFQIIVRLPLKTDSGDKRFELPTLKRYLSLYVIYLLLLGVFHAAIPAANWPLAQGVQRLIYDEHIMLAFRLVEFITAFTLLGYVIAEMRGRKNEALETTLCWTFFIAAGSAVLIEIIKTYPALSNINVASIIIIISAAIYGAVIYRLHLSAIENQ
jgi:hypothetical protein